MGWLRRRPASPGGPRITLVDRVGCHLCLEAAEVVARVAERTGTEWVRVDVDSSPDLLHKYADLVPVVLVDGREVARWTITDEVLTSAVVGRRRRGRQ